MQVCHSFHLPTTRSHFKVDQSSHVQFIDKYILMISNMYIQDAQRAVAVAKKSTYDTGGRTRSEGNVLVGGRPVCDDGWGDNEADVACRLGPVLFVYIPCSGFLHIFLDLSATSTEVQQQTHDLETLLEENLLWTTSNAR